MTINSTIRNAAGKAKTFVSEHKQVLFNVATFVAISGIGAAVIFLNRENLEQNGSINKLHNNANYLRDHVYDLEQKAGIPVLPNDEAYHQRRIDAAKATETN